MGAAAGVLSGLLGVGGGILFVPTLTLALGLSQVRAEATSLLAIIPVALVGAWRQHRYGNVDVRDGGNHRASCPRSASPPGWHSRTCSRNARCGTASRR